MKFQATVDCLDVKTKIGKVLGKTILDLKCWTSSQVGGHIRLTLPMFDIILFFTRWRDGILQSREEVLLYWENCSGKAPRLIIDILNVKLNQADSIFHRQKQFILWLWLNIPNTKRRRASWPVGFVVYFKRCLFSLFNTAMHMMWRT